MKKIIVFSAFLFLPTIASAAFEWRECTDMSIDLSNFAQEENLPIILAALEKAESQERDWANYAEKNVGLSSDEYFMAKHHERGCFLRKQELTDRLKHDYGFTNLSVIRSLSPMAR